MDGLENEAGVMTGFVVRATKNLTQLHPPVPANLKGMMTMTTPKISGLGFSKDAVTDKDFVTDMDAVMNLIEGIQEEHKAEVKALRDEIAAASVANAIHTDRKVVSSSHGVVGTGENVLLKEVRDFLASTRPDTEFFTLKNPRYQFILNPGEEAPWSDKQQRPSGHPTPSIALSMNWWFGPGKELKGMNGQPKYKIGHCDLTHNDLVKITKQDVVKYHLPKEILLRDNGVFDLSVLLARIYSDNDYRNGVLLNGEQFKEIMRAEYETLWAQMENQHRLQETLSKLRTGAEKTGMLANVIAPPPASSGSNIVEPSMAGAGV